MTNKKQRRKSIKSLEFRIKEHEEKIRVQLSHAIVFEGEVKRLRKEIINYKNIIEKHKKRL